MWYEKKISLPSRLSSRNQFFQCYDFGILICKHETFNALFFCPLKASCCAINYVILMMIVVEITAKFSQLSRWFIIFFSDTERNNMAALEDALNSQPSRNFQHRAASLVEWPVEGNLVILSRVWRGLSFISRVEISLLRKATRPRRRDMIQMLHKSGELEPPLSAHKRISHV